MRQVHAADQRVIDVVEKPLARFRSIADIVKRTLVEQRANDVFLRSQIVGTAARPRSRTAGSPDLVGVVVGPGDVAGIIADPAAGPVEPSLRGRLLHMDNLRDVARLGRARHARDAILALGQLKQLACP